MIVKNIVKLITQIVVLVLKIKLFVFSVMYILNTFFLKRSKNEKTI